MVRRKIAPVPESANQAARRWIAKHWEKVACLALAVVFALSVWLIHSWFPILNDTIALSARVMLALLAAFAGALLPGALEVRVEGKGNRLRGTSSFAMFLIVFMFNPPATVSTTAKSISPASGLALGYFVHHLKPAVQKTLDGCTVKTDAGEHECVPGALTISVAIPDRAFKASLQYVQTLKASALSEIGLFTPSGITGPSGAGRCDTLYRLGSTNPLATDSMVISIPTTLAVIDYVRSLRGLSNVGSTPDGGDESMSDKREAEEIERFRVLLERLIDADPITHGRVRVLRWVDVGLS